VLASLNIGAVLAGTAVAGLTASALGLGLGAALTAVGVEGGAGIGLVSGAGAGLVAGGWVAGSRAAHSERFHGAVTGLVVAFLVVVIARLGGSAASTAVVAWMAALGAALAGFSGWLAGRRKRSGD